MGRHSDEVMVGEWTRPSRSTMKETTALPSKSLCSLGGTAGGTLTTGSSGEAQTGMDCGAERALANEPRTKATAMRYIIFMAGLTPKFRGTAQRIPLKREVRRSEVHHERAEGHDPAKGSPDRSALPMRTWPFQRCQECHSFAPQHGEPGVYARRSPANGEGLH